jgi:hypothetical protein
LKRGEKHRRKRRGLEGDLRSKWNRNGDVISEERKRSVIWKRREEAGLGKRVEQ